MRNGERKAKNPISLSAPSAIFPLVASSSKSNRLMALVKSIRKFSTPASTSFLCSGRSMQFCCRYFARISTNLSAKEGAPETDSSDVPTSGISRSLAEILRELNKKVPDSLVKVRMEDGFAMKYIPWHIVNRIMNSHAPEWSGEVRSITYSPDGKSVSVVYRVTLYGTDAEIYRESSGTASVDDTSYGDPVQKAEAMAFRRACARLGLGLHLYHEDMS